MSDNGRASKLTRPLLPIKVGAGNVHYARGIKAGPFVFATGVSAIDGSTGSPAILADPARPLNGAPVWRRESEILLDRAEEVLRAGGSAFDRVVRADQFYSDWRAVAFYQETRRRRLGSYVPPSTSILQNACSIPGLGIDLSFIAISEDAPFDLEPIAPQGLDLPAHTGFTPIAVAGDLVFIAGFMAAHGEGDLDGIAPQAKVPSGHLWKGNRIKLETTYLIEKKLLPALKAAGCTASNVVKAHIYLRDREDLPAFNDVWQSYFSSSPHASLIMHTPVPGFAIEDARLEINLVAVRDLSKKKIIQSARFEGVEGQPAAVRAGDFLFVSTLFPAPLETADKLPYFGSPAERQMESILDIAEDICAAAGASLENVVRAQHFVTDLRNFYPAYQVWRRRLGDVALPCSAIGVTKPHAAPDSSIALDLWVYSPEHLP